MTVPAEIQQGDTVAWIQPAVTDLDGNPATSASWTLTTYLRTNTASEGATVTGTARGRKGLLTAYAETLAGTNESTSEHVYDALTVDGDTVPGCKVYNGAGNAADPKAPIPGTVYLAGVVIASKVVEASANGDKLASKRGAVAVAKDFIERELDLPARKYRTFRLLPGEAVSLKSGAVAFHAAENGPVRPGAADIATLTA